MVLQQTKIYIFIIFLFFVDHKLDDEVTRLLNGWRFKNLEVRKLVNKECICALIKNYY